MTIRVHSNSENSHHLDTVMNVSDALERLGNDEDLLREIIEIYLEDAPELIERVRAATAEGKAQALQRAAHILKGLGATLSAAEVVAAAAHLEHIGATQNLAEAPSATAAVITRVDELNEAARDYLKR